MDLFTAFALDQDIEPPIPPEERQYYQDPSYYKDYAPSMSFDAVNGTCKVITFQERKKISYPSKRGLYVAEIKLLSYCSSGKLYPHPKHGYPGLWWYQYGIKNVGFHLKTLEVRGFIRMNDKQKYELTELGKQELKDNAYVTDCKTTVAPLGRGCCHLDVWEINRRIAGGDTSQWEGVAAQIESEIRLHNDNFRKSQEEQRKRLGL